MLLKLGCEVDDRRNDMTTPLWIASQMGHVDIVKILLKYNANVDAERIVSKIRITK